MMIIAVDQGTYLWPFLIYGLAVCFVLTAMYVVSYLLGERHTGRATDKPYESGIPATGSARILFSVKFYLVAMLFVIFDLEAVFIFSWAVAARDTGWTGYWVLVIFVGILVVGLLYEWRMGALDWLSRERRFLRRERQG